MCRPTAASSTVVGDLAEERARGLERDDLAVLAAVEDDLGGDAVVVHVPEAGGDVVMPFGLPVPPEDDAMIGVGIGLVTSNALPERDQRARVAGDRVVERLEVLRRAVRPQVVVEAGSDVGVGRHHHQRLVAVTRGSDQP